MEESFYSEILKKNLVPLILGLAGIIFVAIGLFSVFSQSSKTSNSLQFQAGSQSKNQNPQSQQAKIVVDIEGGVLKPGIYSLSQVSRMHDLIVASGGLSAQADRDWFAKNINQAAKLTDGQKVYIIRVGESISSADTTTVQGSQPSSATSLIDINSASLTDLDSLPGVGPVTAQKIADNRPYSSINDLVNKKVVASSEFDKIKDKISAN